MTAVLSHEFRPPETTSKHQDLRSFEDLDGILRDLWKMEINLRGLHLLIHLHLLGRGERLKSLASAIGLTSAGMTGVADQLELKGLVVREVLPNDRRSIYLSLTKEGTQFALWIGDSLGGAFGHRS
jgi:DNA-binding MarR family transcriptional regulator